MHVLAAHLILRGFIEAWRTFAGDVASTASDCANFCGTLGGCDGFTVFANGTCTIVANITAIEPADNLRIYSYLNDVTNSHDCSRQSLTFSEAINMPIVKRNQLPVSTSENEAEGKFINNTVTASPGGHNVTTLACSTLFRNYSTSQMPDALKASAEEVYLAKANSLNDYSLWFGENATTASQNYPWQVQPLDPQIVSMRENEAVRQACKSLVEIRMAYRNTATGKLDNYLDYGTVTEMTNNLRSRYNGTFIEPTLKGSPFNTSCVTEEGDCGATVPMYEHFSFGDIRYSLSPMPGSDGFECGRVLCFFWHL